MDSKKHDFPVTGDIQWKRRTQLCIVSMESGLEFPLFVEVCVQHVEIYTS